jgi:hypothetical protein
MAIERTLLRGSQPPLNYRSSPVRTSSIGCISAEGVEPGCPMVAVLVLFDDPGGKRPVYVEAYAM